MNGSTVFNDIAGLWTASDLIHAASTGIITGFKNGSFRPERKVSRVCGDVSPVKARRYSLQIGG
ncbi:S-layer homology domain-containing protein [Paenibacillus glacialis]|uniref:S-layer homology domain-containing protein n=1 Tax=Paenibacillus glacialis TaxID=494026 RepID=UPI0009FE6F37